MAIGGGGKPPLNTPLFIGYAVNAMRVTSTSWFDLCTYGDEHDAICRWLLAARGAVKLWYRGASVWTRTIINVVYIICNSLNVLHLHRLRRAITNSYCYHPPLRRRNVFTRICPSVRPSVCDALRFNSLDLECSPLAHRNIFKISRSSSRIKVIGSRSRSQEQKSVSAHPVRGWFAFDWKATLF